MHPWRTGRFEFRPSRSRERTHSSHWRVCTRHVPSHSGRTGPAHASLPRSRRTARSLRREGPHGGGPTASATFDRPARTQPLGCRVHGQAPFLKGRHVPVPLAAPSSVHGEQRRISATRVRIVKAGPLASRWSGSRHARTGIHIRVHEPLQPSVRGPNRRSLLHQRVERCHVLGGVARQ